jgi:hypothetical protein
VPKRRSTARIPSLQHFSALLGGTAGQIEKRIRGLSNLPPVSYTKLREQWIIDLIGVSILLIENACKLLHGELNRASNLEAVRALGEYLRIHKPEKLLFIDKRYYPIGRGLLVPVNPPGVILDSEGPKLFWPSFWKHDKFDELTRAIFGSILERSIFRLGDYKDMPLAFVDFSAPSGSKERGMKVLNRRDFCALTDIELRIETDKFVEAYLRLRADETGAPMKENKDAADLPLFLDRPWP